MNEIMEASLAAALTLFMTVLGSLIVANIVGGGRHLPLGLQSDEPPKSGPLAIIGVALFSALAIGAQVVLVAAALGPNPMYGTDGTRILLIEPPLAIFWSWYLTKRYERGSHSLQPPER